MRRIGNDALDVTTMIYGHIPISGTRRWAIIDGCEGLITVYRDTGSFRSLSVPRSSPGIHSSPSRRPRIRGGQSRSNRQLPE